MPDESRGPKMVPRLFEKPSGRRGLNPRPLDPQSDSGRRPAWLAVARRAVDLRELSPAIARHRPPSSALAPRLALAARATTLQQSGSAGATGGHGASMDKGPVRL
jgi:hypothetical protein